MKYTLSINQFAVVSIGLADKVDLIDLCIFDAFKSFANSSRCEKMVDEGGIWFWISYAEIISELPLSGIKTNDGIYRRMKKLAEAGIIIFHPNNQRLSRTFFKWGANYDAIERRQNTSTPTDEKPEVVKDLRMKNRRGTDEKPEVPTDETPNNHYTINHTTNHREVVSEKKSLTPPAPARSENFTHSEPEKKESVSPAAAMPGAMPKVAAAEPSQGYPSSPINTSNRIGLKPLAANGDEAEAVITEWANENIETVRFKYERAKRMFTNSDLEKLILKFCGQYSSHPDTGVMQRFLSDPATFFNNKLSSWLVDQPKFERMAEPKGGASRDDARYIAPRASEKIPAYTP